jgi:hypothetical protein
MSKIYYFMVFERTFDYIGRAIEKTRDGLQKAK